jgi:hypothetical protein
MPSYQCRRLYETPQGFVQVSGEVDVGDTTEYEESGSWDAYVVDSVEVICDSRQDSSGWYRSAKQSDRYTGWGEVFEFEYETPDGKISKHYYAFTEVT